MNQIDVQNNFSRMLPPLQVKEFDLPERNGQAISAPAHSPAKVENSQKALGLVEVPEKEESESITLEEIQQQIEEANQVLRDSNSKQLSFFVDDATGKQGVRVIDTRTQEVIRQFPPEETLNIAARIREQIGALLDEKA